MSNRHSISTARRQLFDLFDRVTGSEGDRVVIVRRNTPKEAVLVSRDYLDHLETTARRLTARAATSFSLFGSATLLVPPDDVLRATRQEQARLRARKQAKLAGRRRP